jgi:hypothetical protein
MITFDTPRDLPAVTIEVKQVRELAGQLLRQLRIDRALSEQRLADNGRNDPIKIVTGHSALDDAIQSTEGLIKSIDEQDPIG